MLLVGKSNAGKTTAIKNLLCRKLLQVVLRHDDISLVVKLAVKTNKKTISKTVLFYSCGDPGQGNSWTKEQIDYFKKEEFDICITASRGKEGSRQEKTWEDAKKDFCVKEFIIRGDKVPVEKENEMFTTLEEWLGEDAEHSG